jgi:integrase
VASRILAAARGGSRLASLYEVGFLAGLRLGELTGLQLDDLVVTPSGKRKLKAGLSARYQRFVEKDFRRLCEKAKLPDHLTPHSMRHTFVCVHIAQGCHPKWLQQQMGHSSINVTLDTYARWWNLEDHAAADALGALVGSEVAAKAMG